MAKTAGAIIQELESVITQLKKLDPNDLVNQYYVLMEGQTEQIIVRHAFVSGNDDKQNNYNNVKTYGEAYLQQIDDEIDIVYVSQKELEPYLESPLIESESEDE